MAAFAPKEDRLIFGEISDECKPAVVGIDFGTAYSGTAITFKAQSNVISFCAPGADSVQVKVPTSLLLDRNGGWIFGNAAETRYSDELNGVIKGEHPVQLFKRFKMALKEKNSGFDTLTAMSVAGQHRSLLDLVTTSLRILKEEVMRKVAEGYAEILTIEDIQWVLTVPAIWNDFGKAFMRKAAFQAGMMSNELSENLLIVLEPEAAALAISKNAKTMNMNCMVLGGRFIVLDCGGGTVDITAHEVRSVSPQLRLSSIAIPSGGAWGGDYVNIEFQNFLRLLFGTEVFEDTANAYALYGITAEFDKMKKAYDPKNDPNFLRMHDMLESKARLVELVNEYNAKYPDKPISVNNGFVKMSKALMMSFFEPFLEQTVAATRKVLKDTPGIYTIMVVGGFGSSRVMIDRIFAEFNGKRGMTVVVPVSPGPQEAIVTGAVYFGLYKNIIETRLSPYTYGIAMRINDVPDSFHLLVRRGQELPKDHMVEQAGMPGSPAQTALSWRLFRSNLDEPKTVKGETPMGKLPVKCPLNTNPLMRLQRARFYFGGPEIVIKVVNALNEEHTAQIVPPPDASV